MKNVDKEENGYKHSQDFLDPNHSVLRKIHAAQKANCDTTKASDSQERREPKGSGWLRAVSPRCSGFTGSPTDQERSRGHQISSTRGFSLPLAGSVICLFAQHTLLGLLFSTFCFTSFFRFIRMRSEFWKCRRNNDYLLLSCVLLQPDADFSNQLVNTYNRAVIRRFSHDCILCFNNKQRLGGHRKVLYLISIIEKMLICDSKSIIRRFSYLKRVVG